MKKITKKNIEAVNFDKGEGLVPAIIQDPDTMEVLMLGYMNAGSLLKTLDEGKVTFFSRSKQRLWTKGETSENFLIFKEAYLDCDDDTILVWATPQGPVCHTGQRTCFDQPKRSEAGNIRSLDKKFDLKQLENIILDRKNNPKAGSYTNHLFDKGINKIAQKVGEEAVELVIEAKDSNDILFKGEAADLLYHFSVLLANKNISLDEIYQVLENRHVSKD